MNVRVLLSLVLACSAWGCTATHLVYVHQNTFGLDISTSTEGTSHLSFGYDRETFMIVPRRVSAGDQSKNDAMSLVAVSQVYVEGFARMQMRHTLAAGKPAIDVAKGTVQVQAVVEKTLTATTATEAKKEADAGGKP